jgi:hypothetical protein
MIVIMVMFMVNVVSDDGSKVSDFAAVKVRGIFLIVSA